MKQKMVMTENVKGISGLVEALKKRPNGVPGLGLIYGINGRGKTEAVRWVLGRNPHYHYIRINAITTPSTMLAKLLFELGEMPMYRSSDMYEKLVEILRKKDYLFFIDEVDYCLHRIQTLEILRDLQDETGTIFIFVGMENIERRLRNYGHIRSRIMEVVKVKDVSKEDIENSINQLLGLEYEDEVINEIDQMISGSFRKLIVVLNKLERLTQINNSKQIQLSFLKKG